MTNTAEDSRWPSARLDHIGRARALAAAMPGTWIEERVLPVPFQDAWDYVSDLERSVPQFDGDVSAIRITGRNGSALRVRATASAKFLWFPSWFDVDLHPGWCLMHSRPQAYVVVMAAEPEGPDTTRFAHVEGIAIRSRPLIARLLGPVLAVSRWRHRRHLPHDVDNIVRALTETSSGRRTPPPAQ